MKLALISCGRSDYSIYLPLIKRIKEDPFFHLNIIAFGTHLSQFYGNTVEMFYRDGLKVAYELESLVLGDSPEAISTAMGLTTIKFSSIWSLEKFDMIIVLGDRYEMFAAISASIPFNIPVAHIHGGETTEGAFDDIFRHSITSMSKLHFVTTENHAKRVEQIINKKENIFLVGAPALDNFSNLKLLTVKEFKEIWNIDLSKPTVLVTFHPETIESTNNIKHVRELCKAMAILEKQFVITMPNNDTMGTKVRSEIMNFVGDNKDKFKIIESFGTLGYYSCMKECEFLLGNTSSGIIEAASFKKYVINIGERQKGRDSGPNVIHCALKCNSILEAVNQISKRPNYNGKNIYGDGTATSKIIFNIKEFYNKHSLNN